jgi:hypothetical protein
MSRTEFGDGLHCWNANMTLSHGSMTILACPTDVERIIEMDEREKSAIRTTEELL